jgi:hypothetical protein
MQFEPKHVVLIESNHVLADSKDFLAGGVFQFGV